MTDTSKSSSQFVLVEPETASYSKSRGEEHEDETVEPIAIVGMACKLPGDVNSPSELWDMLVNGRTGQCDLPSDRWNMDAFYHPKGADRPGSMSTKGGYFLKDDVRKFENTFFGINNLEATYMDPQQRKLLEVIFECFESAGICLEDISGSNTGCYVGNFTMDFLVMQSRDPEYFHRYTATGMGTTILANRVNHVFNLKGPSMVIDTACSSSLVSLHTAVMALRNHECDAAVVAGANLVQLPEQHMATMKAGVLSNTSSCHTFDSSADGYGRADVIGALFVKRLSDAIRDGDPIRSVIRASAINTNGKTKGISLPSATAQEAVIRKAHEVAGLDLRKTVYIECHGTGTLVGDPIEIEGLSLAFEDRPKDSSLLIGAVKPNLGHSEAASGISSIIKATLILESGLIPPTIGINNINPKIKTSERNINIVTRNTPFPLPPLDSGAPRRVGVNSFGYGGSNAHVVLEAADAFLPRDHEQSTVSAEVLALLNKTFLLPFSAANSTSLANRVSTLGADRINVADLAYTLSNRRSKLPARGFLLARQSALKKNLKSSELQTKMVSRNNCTDSAFAFVFTGQGAQWAGMGKGLIEQSPIARSSIQKMDAVLQKLPIAHRPSWKLLDSLSAPAETSQLNEVTHSQPACTAIQIALIDTLACWGIKPQGVVGHSSGEIAAAYAANYLTSEQAIIIAYYRGYVVGKLPSTGQMLAVGLSEEDGVEQIKMAEFQGRLVVACVNSPVSITMSGDSDAADIMQSRLGTSNVFRRKLIAGGRAYHSHHMKIVGQEYEDLVNSALDLSKAIPSKQAGVLFVSSVTAIPMVSPADSKYWRANLESPVLFSQAVQMLQSGRKFQLVELGPHAALKLPISQIRTNLGISEEDLPYYSALYRGEDSMTSILNLMGQLFLSGADIPFEKINSIHFTEHPKDAKAVGVMVKDLPPYSWTYDQVLWNESRASLEFRQRKFLRHELLGSLIAGGNLTDHSWRNVLILKDVPWLEDHKLDQAIVFPAAAFVGMAIEAKSQIHGQRLMSHESIELKHVNILAALTLSANATDYGVEVFTVLKPQSLSGASKSKTWWHFEITSVRESISVIHATGLIRIVSCREPLKAQPTLTANLMEPSAVRNWYEKLIKEGLNFGPEFQSIKKLQIHRGKSLLHVLAEAPHLQMGPKADEKDDYYYVHPITIDAMIQAGIISTSGGLIDNLRGQIPVAIESIAIRASSVMGPPESCFMHARAEPRGFGQTSLFADLCNAKGTIYAQIKGIRMVSYEGAVKNNSFVERHPILRVLWKPDIYGLGLPDANTLLGSITRFQSSLSTANATKDDGFAKILTALDFITHKTPTLKILELCSSHHPNFTNAYLDIIRDSTEFPRHRSFTTGKLVEGGITIAKQPKSGTEIEEWIPYVSEDTFDLVILTETDTTGSTIANRLDVIPRLLSPRALVLALSRATDTSLHRLQDFDITSCRLEQGGSLILARKHSKESPKDTSAIENIVLVEDTLSDLGESMMQAFRDHISVSATHTTLSEIDSASIPSKATIIVTVEMQKNLLSSINDAEMKALKVITDNAANLVWITSTEMLNCKNPNTALVNGLSRALMLEQPSLKFFTLDIDSTTSATRTTQNILHILAQKEDLLDFEFVQQNGVIHVSRFVPDEKLNAKFREKQGRMVVTMPLKDVQDARIAIQDVGQFDTLSFRQEVEQTSLPDNFVEVEVKSVGLNAKDLYVFGGKTETENGTCGLEFTGIIKSIGFAVNGLAAGDCVVVMAPHNFKLVERVPHWACMKMEDGEDFNTISTLSTAFSTAIYALHDRARIQPQETVLIHSGAGGLGIAAIQIAKLAGAEIFTTVGSQEKREYLIKTFGIKPSHIFNSRDSSFLEGIRAATDDRGVDVILNSLTGDLLHDSWLACADFGRFVEVGKRDIVDAGNLNMRLFLRNATFTAFDLTGLYYSKNLSVQAIWTRLLKDTLKLYREGQIQAIKPLRIFDVSEITDAFRHFASKDRMGKIAISFENPESLIKVVPFKHETTFSPEKSYLLIGCLGGLGKSIAKWMVARGARKFVFLGRSGTDRPVARNLVDDLRAVGVEVDIVRGDVVNAVDVQNAVDSISGVLGGVIQAAMGLDESLWATMKNESWHTSIDPKVIGTWNIHKSIATREACNPLEFFLMTSSVSGSVGTATESNYCSANHFLDAFARYRHSLNLPAIALGLGMISEVGYLHENPDIEALLLRKGIQAINEDELIQIVDLALSSQGHMEGLGGDLAASNHILTGLEPHGLKDLRKKGFEGDHIVLSDPRACLLASALSSSGSNDSSSHRSNVSTALKTALETTASLREAIAILVKERFSNLILISIEKLEMEKKLAAYGMDSMLAAEFRTWMWQVFRVDVPFLELLGEKVTLEALTMTIAGKIAEKQ
ncbi:hypothetical protein BGAL_0050g00300 [Botrytis galanthina]|uniref:Uncharacterized protein n=1 Tax=Botrytis galanthina TaxID=278940 RepID=A0A4S8R6B5_9HELO|nr:hypothetical protein BGAL_0050g00300 [Botrytis galanthina]